MNRCYLVLCVLLAVGVSAQAIIVPGGDFQMYKPGTSIGADFNQYNNSYAKGMGAGLTVLGGGSALYDDGTNGSTVDLPGWVLVNGDNDLAPNGYGDTTGWNGFASWGSHPRIESAASLGTSRGGDYLLTAMVSGPVANQALVLELLLDGSPLAVADFVDAPTSGNTVGTWVIISRTYEGVAAGGELTIRLGVDDSNTHGNRVIFDNVALVPEPATMLLLGLGGLLVRRKR